MPHLALLGDSVFDNGRYVHPGPTTLDHLRDRLPPDWGVDLLARDRATSLDIADQLAGLQPHHSQLVLSCGGGDALKRIGVLAEPVSSTMEALLMVADIVDGFRCSYRAAVEACLDTGRTLTLCTIYHGHFRDEADRRAVGIGLSTFNDVILRTAIDYSLRVVDLRRACHQPRDFVASLEPSAEGGAKVADAIARALFGSTIARPTALIAA